ncbi:hypothetical protein BU23DRAFT_275434 [Bimuria novae-zelandiae CBS 107.79]|uniref:Uncharacterized protein n=1 Tax=Bimuria novae-zelandiae CBS 107.79 TaxID=1447943 RepID=A0A6A5VKR8_9PLEO|nr:hypothetical protein BU23DRAFT_275434 [Bimuria novae-zelandiae CBS 107.79]
MRHQHMAGCPAGSTCASVAGYCSSLTTKTATSISTSASTSATTITTTSISSSISTSIRVSSRTSRSSSDTCAVPTMPASPKRDVSWNLFEYANHITNRARPKRPCTYLPHSSGQNLPSVTFKNVNGKLDDLIQSMCAGKYSKRTYSNKQSVLNLR